MRKEYKDQVADKIAARYAGLEERIMKDIVRRIQKTGEITSTADWQINRLRILGYSSEDIEREIKSTLGASYPEMFELYDEVIQTLEDAQSSAGGGAYEYKLTYVGSDNAEKVLYDSTTVGGEGASKAGEGLKQIDNSTQEYFYLGRLASNNTGTVHLTVGVEGETQGNGYQLTLAKLRMNFAVEKVSAGKTITKNKIVKTTNTVKTGDTARVLLFCVLALISGLILLAYGIYTLNKNTKRRRQKGE